ncbi:hypothetical protein Q3G72_019802 [Acer saccharum]|nr:hypothetical protein Q3G72_019802 [Acer saccharum]
MTRVLGENRKLRVRLYEPTSWFGPKLVFTSSSKLVFFKYEVGSSPLQIEVGSKSSPSPQLVLVFNSILLFASTGSSSVLHLVNWFDSSIWSSNLLHLCYLKNYSAVFKGAWRFRQPARQHFLLLSMGNGKEHPSTLTPSSSNPSSVEFNRDRPNPQETEDCSSWTCQNVEIDGEIDGDIDGDDMIEEPKNGMEFNSLEDLLSYYKSYGKMECKAKINALRCDGKLQLTMVHNIHNHGLSPKKSRFFRCNREMSDTVKRVLDTNDIAGVRMNKSFGSLVVGAGGFENLPFSEKDCRNYIDKARHLKLGAGGAGALREYFLRMQYKNLRFFALMDLDDDGRLKNVFWADPRSRAAYQYFGDVVTFDTTYLTNRYGMPFAPFVGVNHHGQSILLGAGLISNEDTETFVWLFQTWLQCVDGIAPKAIITDQDRAMKNAQPVVMLTIRWDLV